MTEPYRPHTELTTHNTRRVSRLCTSSPVFYEARKRADDANRAWLDGQEPDGSLDRGASDAEQVAKLAGAVLADACSGACQVD